MNLSCRPTLTKHSPNILILHIFWQIHVLITYFFPDFFLSQTLKWSWHEFFFSFPSLFILLTSDMRWEFHKFLVSDKISLYHLKKKIKYLESNFFFFNNDNFWVRSCFLTQVVEANCLKANTRSGEKV